MGPNWYHSHWHDDDDLGALRRCRPAQNVDHLNGVQKRTRQKKKKNYRNKMTTLYQNLLEKVEFCEENHQIICHLLILLPQRSF
jgi:hypothetical protein